MSYNTEQLTNYFLLEKSDVLWYATKRLLEELLDRLGTEMD